MTYSLTFLSNDCCLVVNEYSKKWAVCLSGTLEIDLVQLSSVYIPI